MGLLDFFRTTSPSANLAKERLRIIVLRTVKGRGVSFMENRMEWHYLPLSAEQYRSAIAELDAS